MVSTAFDEALLLATSLHREQRRKGSDIPYIAHLLAVAALVLEHNGSEEEAIAALLHDTAEDQGGEAQLAAIRDRFGENVAAIVAGCTDTLETPKPAWKPRKQAFVERVRSAPYSVRLVVAADKLHNALAITSDYERCGEALWLRFTGKKEGTLWYYSAIAAALRDATKPEETNLQPLVRQLERAVSNLDALAQPIQA